MLIHSLASVLLVPTTAMALSRRFLPHEKLDGGQIGLHFNYSVSKSNDLWLESNVVGTKAGPRLPLSWLGLCH